MEPELFLNPINENYEQKKLTCSSFDYLNQELNADYLKDQNEKSLDYNDMMIQTLETSPKYQIIDDEFYCQFYEQYHEQLFENLWAKNQNEQLLNKEVFRLDGIKMIDHCEQTYMQQVSNPSLGQYIQQSNKQSQCKATSLSESTQNPNLHLAKSQVLIGGSNVDRKLSICSLSAKTANEIQIGKYQKYQDEFNGLQNINTQSRQKAKGIKNSSKIQKYFKRKNRQRPFRGRLQKRDEQLMILQKEFENNSNWCQSLVRVLAFKTGLTPAQVYKWNWDYKIFQNQMFMKDIHSLVKCYGKIFNVEKDIQKQAERMISMDYI
ncbi:UNKNOWN [Stylonychia lemnae]|uniref:Homeobox domain-containing protein n=1 Tax=Stylonychia lemnae TaxID=5949 RepID=A0A077ZWL6_STYLE|nr:UNKNOWN [Stylonychia lemnae]|eukprot:CDW72866.1 UNKNOWN [Stylonychia lemnae]